MRFSLLPALLYAVLVLNPVYANDGTATLVVANLGSEPRDFALAPEQDNLAVIGLAPGTLHLVASNIDSMAWPLYHRTNPQEGWVPERTREGHVLRYRMEANQVYLVILDHAETHFLEISSSEAPGPAWALVNRSGLPLSVQIGKEWDQGTVIRVQSLGALVHTGFHGIEPEYTARLFWREPVMPRGQERYAFGPNLPGHAGSRTLVVFPPRRDAQPQALVMTLPVTAKQ